MGGSPSRWGVALSAVYGHARPADPPAPTRPEHHTFSWLCLIIPALVVAVASGRVLFPALIAAGRSPPSTSSSNVGRSTSLAIRTAFSAVVALSCVLIELVIFDLVKVLDESVRTRAIDGVVTALLVLVVVVVPTTIIRTSAADLVARFGRAGRRRREMPTTSPGLTVPVSSQLIGLGLWLSFFWLVGGMAVDGYIIFTYEPGSATTAVLSRHRDLFPDAVFERLAVLGMTLMGVLSGAAGVANIWHHFGPRQALLSLAGVRRQEAVLAATTELLESKRRAGSGLSKTQSSSLHSSVVLRTDPAQLELEIAHLAITRDAVAAELSTARARIQAASRDRSLLGRAVGTVSLVLAAYCGVRVLTALFRLVLVPVGGRTNEGPGSNPTAIGLTGSCDRAFVDPLARLLASITSQSIPGLDEDGWRSLISILPAGVVLAGALSAGAQTAVVASRWRGGEVGAAVVSILIASYVLAASVVIGTTLTDSILNRSGVNGDRAGDWVEAWFLVSAGGMACLVGFRKMIGVDLVEDVEEQDIEAGKIN